MLRTRSSKYQCYNLWIDQTEARTHDLPQQRRARWPLHHWQRLEHTTYHNRGEHADHYTTDRGSNPRSTTTEASTLTTTPLTEARTHDIPQQRRARWPLHHWQRLEPTTYHNRGEHADHYTTDRGSNPRHTTIEASTLTTTPPTEARTHDIPQ
jgi:hypothetical protein